MARSEIAHPGDEWSDDLSVTSARHSVVMEKGETTSKNINKKMDILNSTTNGEHSNVEADVCANDSQCCCQCQWWTDFCLSFRAGVGKGDGKSVSLSPVPGSGSLDQMTIGVKQQEYAPVIVTVVRESNSGSNKFSSDLHRSGSIVSDDTTTHIHDSKHNNNHNSATVSPKSPLTRPMGHDHSRAVFPVVHDNITLHGLQTSPEMRVRSSADNVKTDAPAYNINDPHEGPLSNMTETSRHLGLSYDSYSGTSDNNARDVDTNGSFNNGNGNSFGLHGTGSVVSVGSASIPERASLDGSEGGIKRAVHDLDNRSVYRQPSDHQQGVISSIFEQYTQPSVSYSNVNNIATSNINTSYEYHRQFISPFPSQLPSPRFKKSTARPPQPLELSQLSQSPPESQSPLFSLPDQNQDQESPATCYVDDPLSPFDEGLLTLTLGSSCMSTRACFDSHVSDACGCV